MYMYITCSQNNKEASVDVMNFIFYMVLGIARWQQRKGDKICDNKPSGTTEAIVHAVCMMLCMLQN